MAIVPAGPRLAIVDLPAEEISRLVLPLGVSGRPSVAIVTAVGDDCALPLSPGDKVFYSCKAADLGDVKIIDAGCVLAYEREADK